MASRSIPVDLFNPGQVLACMGLAELAGRLLGEVRCGFDWREAARPRFHLVAAGSEDPVAVGLAFLDAAELVALAPERSANRAEKWEVATVLVPESEPFPTPDSAGPPQLPARLQAGGVMVDLYAWADTRAGTGRDNLKFWAGAGGYPGVAFLRDALSAARTRPKECNADPFAFAADIGSNLRLDWRGGYVPIDAGFSLNAQTQISAAGYPLVEVLAAVGTAHARPVRLDRLAYRYAVFGSPSEDVAALPLPLARAAISGVSVPFPTRTFLIRLGWAGQEGQARAITSVTEESPS